MSGASCQTATRKSASDAAQKSTTCTTRQLPARELAARGARVARVDAGVDEPVQRHRERPRADHRERDPEQVVRRRRLADGEERADVRERQREDRVLDLHEPREARRQRRERRSGGVHGRHATWAVRSAGARCLVGEQLQRVRERRAEHLEAVAAAARGARQVDDERRPATPRGRAREAVRRLRDRVGADRLRDAGASRSSTSRVASGVTSRGASPVPPVVSTSCARAMSSRRAATICSRSSGTTRRSTSKPSARSSSSSSRRSCPPPRRATRGRRA